MVISFIPAVAKSLRKRLLSADEQLALWQQFLPLKEALRQKLAEQNGGLDPFAQLDLGLGIEPTKRKATKSVFSGGYKNLNLLDIYKSLPKTPELIRARRAQEKLIEHNLPMAVSFAGKFMRARKQTNVNGEDYAQMGALGLTYATYHYTPTKNGKRIKFSTYAEFWIKALVMERAKKNCLIDSGDRPVVFFTEVRDMDGEYTSIFDTTQIDDEPSLSEQLTVVRDGVAYLSPEVESHLSPDERLAVLADLSLPLFACGSLGLPCDDNSVELIRQKKEKAIAKIHQLIA